MTRSLGRGPREGFELRERRVAFEDPLVQYPCLPVASYRIGIGCVRDCIEKWGMGKRKMGKLPDAGRRPRGQDGVQDLRLVRGAEP
jgi:hypothetical protein